MPVSEALRDTPELAPLLELNRVFHAGDNAWEEALNKAAGAAKHKMSIIWANSGDVRVVDSALRSAVEQLKENWPPNELEVVQVRFTPQAGGSLEELDRYMSGVSTAFLIIDTDSPTASCFELAEAAARSRVPTIVISSMDLDWGSMRRFRELEADHRHSFQFATFDDHTLSQTMLSHLNKQLITMDRKKRSFLQSNPV
ncbi:hypothetical protein ACWDQZ_14700 [Streptomyces tendae]